MLQDDLNRIRAEATAQLAGASGKKELEELRVRYLGKKGEVTAILKQMGKLSPEERPVVGKLANEVRAAIEEALEARTSALSAAAFEESSNRKNSTSRCRGAGRCSGTSIRCPWRSMN